VEERRAVPSLEDRAAAETVRVRGAAAVVVAVIAAVGELDVVESTEEAADA
jgi:hypothetical protein